MHGLLVCFQVAESLAAAAPFKEILMLRGVVVVPLPIFGECVSTAQHVVCSAACAGMLSCAVCLTLPCAVLRVLLSVGPGEIQLLFSKTPGSMNPTSHMMI